MMKALAHRTSPTRINWGPYQGPIGKHGAQLHKDASTKSCAECWRMLLGAWSLVERLCGRRGLSNVPREPPQRSLGTPTGLSSLSFVLPPRLRELGSLSPRTTTLKLIFKQLVFGKLYSKNGLCKVSLQLCSNTGSNGALVPKRISQAVTSLLAFPLPSGFVIL